MRKQLRKLLPLAFALHFLAGCPAEVDEATIQSFDRWYDWKFNRMFSLVKQLNALPPGDPARTDLELKIALEQEILENALYNKLLQGVQVSSAGEMFKYKIVPTAEYQHQILISSPDSSTPSIGAAAPSQVTTRPVPAD